MREDGLKVDAMRMLVEFTPGRRSGSPRQQARHARIRKPIARVAGVALVRPERWGARPFGPPVAGNAHREAVTP
jgi:hypothetical protein